MFFVDKFIYWNEWLVGRIVKVYLSFDNCVCKVDVCVGSDKRIFIWFISDIVLFCRKDCESEWICFVLYVCVIEILYFFVYLLILGDIINIRWGVLCNVYWFCIECIFWCCGD